MKFKQYDIVPMRMEGDLAHQTTPRRAQFWGLYGIDDGDNAYAIGDFNKRADAQFIRDVLEETST